MDDTDLPPRFFKVFISHFSSDSMLIPLTYYEELPSRLPKTVILQGSSGGIWNVSLKIEEDEVYFAQGWSKFVRDSSLTDGDFLTFVYDGDRVFEVSIYRNNGCKEMGPVSDVEDDKEDSVCVTLVTSDESNTCSESEIISISKDDDSDDEEEEEEEDTETSSEVKILKTIPRSMNKGKKKMEDVESSDEDSDGDYTEAFGVMDLEESSYSESSYSPNSEKKAKNPKKKGKSKSVDDDNSNLVKRKKQTRTKKVEAKIKNPERYLDDPKNIHFETNVKNRKYELLVKGQMVKDYCLKFPEYVEYIDDIGKLKAETAKWNDRRVCIKQWNVICDRNDVKKEDRVLCELLREKKLVYAIRIHIIRGRDL